MGVLLLTVVASKPFWAQSGVRVCYDYAYWRATGTCRVGRDLNSSIRTGTFATLPETNASEPITIDPTEFAITPALTEDHRQAAALGSE